jgi:hypothetical protein
MISVNCGADFTEPDFGATEHRSPERLRLVHTRIQTLKPLSILLEHRPERFRDCLKAGPFGGQVVGVGQSHTSEGRTEAASYLVEMAREEVETLDR